MVSSDFGKLDVQRHFSSGIDCAMAGMATPVAAAATPVSPAALRNSRRFMVSSARILGVIGRCRPASIRICYHEQRRSGNLLPPIRGAPFPPEGSPGATTEAGQNSARHRRACPGDLDQDCKAGGYRGGRDKPGHDAGEVVNMTGRAIGSRMRPRPDHESVVAVFGNLPPEVRVVAEGLHRIEHLLEVRI